MDIIMQFTNNLGLITHVNGFMMTIIILLLLLFLLFPPGRRRKGRTWNSWTQEVTTGMKERGIGDLEWVDREEWRKKINLP